MWNLTSAAAWSKSCICHSEMNEVPCFTNHKRPHSKLNIKNRKVELLLRRTSLAGVTDATIPGSCGGIPGMNFLRRHIPTASMPFSRSPDISRHMLFSMSRLHIRWYSLKTVNRRVKFQESASQKKVALVHVDGFILIAVSTWYYGMLAQILTQC